MTLDEFNSIFETITTRCEFPRQVWTYNSEPPPGLLSPQRFVREYWNELQAIPADEFKEVVQTWFRNAKHRKFPFVDELRSLHTELFWAEHQRVAEQKEREETRRLNDEQREMFKRVQRVISQWPRDKYDALMERVIEITKDFGYFAEYRGLAEGAQRFAIIKAYEEFKGKE